MRPRHFSCPLSFPLPLRASCQTDDDDDEVFIYVTSFFSLNFEFFSGRSYGGACCNSMLKVLYDAANEAADAAQTMEASEALFDDDEESMASAVAFTRNSTFASIDMNDHCNPSTISWSDLLRKMKAEIKDIEYAQVPTITSTRKFDLNQPFSLVPPGFDKKTAKKRSLLIGCNYANIHGAQLKASHDDVRSMKVC